MECPKCQKEIESCIVVSKYYQTARLDENKLTDYSDLSEGYVETLYVVCPKCQKNITDYVEE